MKIYRIRKTTYGQRPAPGVGKRLAIALGLDPMEDVITSQSPSNAVDEAEVVLNYGRSSHAPWMRDDVRIINRPEAVAVASNKLLTLLALEDKGVPHVEFTTEPLIAETWVLDGHRVFCRTILRGKKGNGIVIARNVDELVDAPLYTKDYPKDREFRVHVFNNEVIDYVQKKRRNNALHAGAVNEDIRNHGRGWIFAHNNIYRSKLVRNVGLSAVSAVGLDFGAVDILATVVGNKVVEAVVCEVNSAPGMSSPTTFNAYVNALSDYVGD